jgi:outer membrane receptor for ferrienterochelin and colicins
MLPKTISSHRDYRKRIANSAPLACAAVIVFAVCAGEASAQSMDYGALQTLFGEPVTTSATGSPQRASDVPASMIIVTQDDIRRSGAYDIPDVLDHLVGLDVLQWTDDYSDVSVRGYDQAGSSRLLVLVDGRQVYADYYGFTPWSTLPVELDAIRQIEVVKGPNSALFGFNAVGGVINIITANPLYDDVTTASVSIGTQGLAEGSAVGTFKIADGAGVRIELGGRRDNDFSSAAPDFFSSVRHGNDRGSADLRGEFQVADNIEFGIDGTHSQVDETEVSPVDVPAYVHYDTDSLKGDLNVDTSFGLLHATAYSNWIRAQYVFGIPVTPGTDSPLYNNQTVVAQLEDVLKIGADDTLRASIEYRSDAVNTSPVGGGNISYDVLSASGMWDWKIDPSISLTNALRIDYLTLSRDGSVPLGYPFSNADWNRTITEESFNSGLVWRASDNDTVRFTIGRGVEIPNLVDFGASLANDPAGNFTGVPTVQPTIVMNYEIGWDRALPALDAHFVASAYHETTQDIASVFGGVLFENNLLYQTSGNIGNSSANGIELSIKGNFLDAWHWGAGYSAEFIADKLDPMLTPDFDRTDFQHTTPNHTVTANLGWAAGPWEADGFLKYESAFYGQTLLPLVGTPSLTFVSGYVSIDGRIAYKLTDQVTFSLSGQNITQSSQQQTSGANVERRVIGGVAVAF